MRYLLDSHTLMWALESPLKLAAGARRIVEDPQAELLLSIATPWEFAIKSNLNKLDARKILEQFEQLIASGGFELLDTEVSHVIRSGMLPWHHKDPFDRLLAAQALELRIPMVSRDRIFDLYGVSRVWA